MTDDARIWETSVHECAHLLCVCVFVWVHVCVSVVHLIICVVLVYISISVKGKVELCTVEIYLHIEQDDMTLLC